MSVKTLNADLDQTIKKARTATQGLRGLAGVGARQDVGVATPAAGGAGRDDRVLGLLGQIFDRLPEAPPNAAAENRRLRP